MRCWVVLLILCLALLVGVALGVADQQQQQQQPPPQQQQQQQQPPPQPLEGDEEESVSSSRSQGASGEVDEGAVKPQNPQKQVLETLLGEGGASVALEAVKRGLLEALQSQGLAVKSIALADDANPEKATVVQPAQQVLQGGQRVSTKVTAAGSEGRGSLSWGIPVTPSLPEVPEAGSAPPGSHLYELGEKARTGAGGEHTVDLDVALSFFQQAAEAGHPGAMYRLGQMRLFGRGLGLDLDAAVDLFAKAAAGGHAAAHRAMAFMYATGRGPGMHGEPSWPRALIHYSMAAAKNDTKAMMTLGYHLLHGHGVTPDCAQAHQLYERVAEKVVRKLEETELSWQVQNHRLYTEFEHEDDGGQEDMIELYKYSADTGDPSAMVTVGHVYMSGSHGVPRDFGTALSYFKRASKLGNSYATGLLGFMHLKGYGVNKDIGMAVKYLKRSADKGHPFAHVQLAKLYLAGVSVPPNAKQAMSYFTKAAQKGNSDGQVGLGDLYLAGIGVSADPNLAKKYYQSAAQKGNLFAVYKLAAANKVLSGGHVHHMMCMGNVALLKRVAEQGQVALQQDDAYGFYEQGDSVSMSWALLHYEELALAGFELAQSNAAFILDVFRGDSRISPAFGNDDSRTRLSLKYYKMAAEQRSPVAHLKVGDFYYEGKGLPEPDMDAAVLAYKKASEFNVPSALFNLGYMHEHGIGLPKDFHLAKRFYDQAGSTSPSAYWPALIAVGHLGVKSMFDPTGLASGEPVILYGWSLESWLLMGLGGLLFMMLLIRSRMIQVG